MRSNNKTDERDMSWKMLDQEQTQSEDDFANPQKQEKFSVLGIFQFREYFAAIGFV